MRDARKRYREKEEGKEWPLFPPSASLVLGLQLDLSPIIVITLEDWERMTDKGG